MRMTPYRRQSELAGDFPGTRTFRALRDQMDRVFDSFFGGWPIAEGESSSGTREWNPDLEICEEEKEIWVCAELPGVDPKDVDVRVSNNILTISGEKREEAEDKKEGYHRSERRYGSFFRALRLPEGTKADQVSAEFDKGVLSIRIPKDEKAASRKIEVRSPSQDGGEQKPEQVEVKQEEKPKPQ